MIPVVCDRLSWACGRPAALRPKLPGRPLASWSWRAILNARHDVMARIPGDLERGREAGDGVYHGRGRKA